jgi:crossover junction endodeoxyribonuclease RuvC
MTNLYIGIDPGITGAIGLLFEDRDPEIADVFTYKRKDGRSQYDFREMYMFLCQCTSRYRAFLALEQQQAMPKQGVSSTFQIGRGYGAWEALCWATTPDFVIVSPRKWKKALGLTSDKEKSREKAIKLFPNLENMLKRKKDHNRAEALLLAHYMREERSKLV